MSARIFAFIEVERGLLHPIKFRSGKQSSKAKRFSLTPAAARTFRRFQDCAKCRFSPTNPSSSLPRFPNTCSFLAAATSASNSGTCSGVTEAVRGKQDGVTLSCKLRSGGRDIRGSHLLVATGRVPNTDDLGLAKAGIA